MIEINSGITPIRKCASNSSSAGYADALQALLTKRIGLEAIQKKYSKQEDSDSEWEDETPAQQSAPKQSFLKNVSDFYASNGTDAASRRHEDILGWDEDQIGDKHDYIQWLFPLDTASNANPTAPVLTPEEFTQLSKDPKVRANVVKSFEKMLSFYALSYDTNKKQVIPTEQFDKKIDRWTLGVGKHNFQRITRILRSLKLLGLKDESTGFFLCLKDIYEKSSYRDRIGERTFQFWANAIS